jgi:outer membrane protein TolC
MRSPSKCFGYIVCVICTFLILLSDEDAVVQEVIYQALSLEDFLALAQQNNPYLGTGREKVRELEADYQLARSKFFPRLTLSFYYERLASAVCHLAEVLQTYHSGSAHEFR